MAYTTIRVSQEGSAAVLTIDNPPVNALHPLVAEEILDALPGIATMSAVRGLVITGVGKHFVAGGDIRYIASLDSQAARTYALAIQSMQAALQDLDLAVIAAINGFALGGGSELSMACDIRVAEASAWLGQPEGRLGVMPGAGGTQHLPRLVPLGRAKRLLFTGRPIAAPEALSIGLVDEVVPDGQSVNAAVSIVEEIAECAPLAVAQIKRSVNLGLAMSVADGHRLEATLFGALFETEDAREGIQAFISKRKPSFEGH